MRHLYTWFGLLTSIIFLLVLTGCQSTNKPQGQTVEILRVVSGQTLEVTGIGNQPNLIGRVRLIGIEAPDVRQRPWGEQAKDRLTQLIGKNPVLLESDVETTDSADRKLAYVWSNGVLLNEKMLREGHALFITRGLNTKYSDRLEKAADWARVMGLGIWNPEKPMRLTPTEFRLRNR